MATAEPLERFTLEVVRQPADPKLMGGLAIARFDEDISCQIDRRLDDYFTRVENDKTKEFGEVVAYTLNLTSNEENKVAAHMVRYGIQNSNYIEFPKDEFSNRSGEFLWSTKFGQHEIGLRRTVAAIVFEGGGIVEDSRIYSLAAHR